MTVRIGFLGCGFIARYHAMQLKLAREPNEIVACFDPDPARAQTFADAESTTAVGSIEDVLAASDAVFVCTWTSQHRPTVVAAAAAGLPVFCEKPLGVDLADATEVAAATTVPNMVGLVLRSSPALLALRALVGDPGAGRVMAVVFRDDQYIPTQGMYGSDWRADPARAGSGTLLEHSIHDVDILEWLAGPIERVAAQHAHFHGITGIEDSVSVVGRFASGASLTLTSVWHDILERPSQRRIEVFCERRLVTLEGDVFGPVHLHSDDLSLALEGEALIEWLARAGIELESAEQQFLEAVAAHMAGQEFDRRRPDVHDALRAHVVVDAIYRSASVGGDAMDVPSTVAERT